MPSIPSPRGFPFSVQDLRSEFDRLLERVWHVGLNTAPLDGQDWAPPVDVFEEADAYQVCIEVPGIPPESIDVCLTGGVLVIKGQKPPPVGGEKVRQLRTECRHGGFCRRYELPGPVREDGIEATARHGVLRITVPKAAEAAGARIRIQTEE